MANLERIVASVELPVTLDFEGGYGQTPQEVQKTAAKVIKAGAVGINFEDRVVGAKALYPVEDQSARIKAIRKAADKAAIPFFINARTDIFLQSSPADHSDQHLEEALKRASAYAEAGASGFFAIGLRNPDLIQRLCELSPLPVNILVFPDTPPPKQLAALGVARISYGAGPYRQVITALKEAGLKALSME